MHKFKYLYLLLFGVVFGLVCSACTYKDDDYDEPSFKVLNPELSFDGTGGVQTINVQADAQPTASVIEGADWCSVAYKDQAAGTYNFDVTVAASQEDEVTTATVRIIQGYSRKDVTITRAKKGAVVTPDVPPADMNKTAMEVAQLMYRVGTLVIPWKVVIPRNSGRMPVLRLRLLGRMPKLPVHSLMQ